MTTFKSSFFRVEGSFFPPFDKWGGWDMNQVILMLFFKSQVWFVPMTGIFLPICLALVGQSYSMPVVVGEVVGTWWSSSSQGVCKLSSTTVINHSVNSLGVPFMHTCPRPAFGGLKFVLKDWYISRRLEYTQPTSPSSVSIPFPPCKSLGEWSYLVNCARRGKYPGE